MAARVGANVATLSIRIEALEAANVAGIGRVIGNGMVSQICSTRSY